ncbi:MAG: hypothetical protein AAF916_06960 [Planctomycetota bacterium]
MGLTDTASKKPRRSPRRARRRYADHGDGIGKVRAAGKVWSVVDMADMDACSNIRWASRVIELRGDLAPGARAEVLAAAVEQIHELAETYA